MEDYLPPGTLLASQSDSEALLHLQWCVSLVAKTIKDANDLL